MIAAPLAEAARRRPARTPCTFLPMRSALGAAAQHLDDGLDLLLVVDAARVLDPALVGPHDSYGFASSLNTRIAFSRRNFGHTWSRNGTFGISVKMRSRLRPIGK